MASTITLPENAPNLKAQSKNLDFSAEWYYGESSYVSVGWFRKNIDNYIVVTPTPQLFGQTFQGPMPGHVPGMPWHWDLHVWVWANNPSGMFAQWNPALSCPAE